MKQPIVIRIYRGSQLEGVKQFTTPQVVIGSNDEVQIRLSDNDVSPLHAVIEERDAGFYVSDLGSATGTRRHGERVLDDRIESGDVIEVGPFRLEFFVGVPKPLAPPKSAPAPATKPQSGKGKKDVPPPTPKEEITESGKVIEDGITASGFIIEDSITAKIPDIVPDLRETEAPSGGSFRSETASASSGIKVATVNAKGTFAPPSEFKNLNEIIRPGKGTVVEVLVAWRERILTSHHFNEKGMVRIGSGPDNEIVLPVLGPTISHTLVRIDSLATVCVTGDMSGELVSEAGVKNFGELTRSNRLVKNAVGYEIGLAQGEMLRVGVQGDLINIYVRYVPEAPKPLVAPLLDLSASEVTGVILATVVSLIFGLYMMIYAPKKLDEEALLEEPLRKAVVTFKPPTPTPKEVVEPKTEPVPQEKKIVKVVDKKKEPQAPSAAIQTKEDPGKAAEARPNPNKSPKKTLTSTRQGGAIDTGKKGASPTSETVDVSKTGLLGVFGSRGTQKKLDKAYTGSGELQGMADSATGFAGDTETRAGDNLGSKIKDTGPGGKGTATVGIAGVGTSGKGGTGNFGYGTGGLGKKGRIEVQVGGQEAEFVGAIDREAIRRVILANKKVIRTCYEMALARNPDLYGKLVIQWDIEERGRVTNAQIVSNTLGNNTVATCLVQRLQTWRFPDPPPDQIGRVTYPFVFTSQ
ncbi:MAG: AgmX/PglI C-terminal domain-containing protein [Bdellovibrionales bacterium]|nr:AgmX/PglI C-terminal domain-containing protein [Bdellovibrionales bacterium]